MNTHTLETERLILRKFTDHDIDDMFTLYRDEEVNRFLPWFPFKTRKEVENYLYEKILPFYEKQIAYSYAIATKNDNRVIGYVHINDIGDSNDMGYALRKEFWHHGIVSEATKAVIEQVKKDGLPYITATHDRNNPRSGMVMQACGMKYCYTYEEQWQPKDFPVFFRMYQLNFDGNEDFVYMKYWDMYENHFIEKV